MQAFSIRALTEADFDGIVEAAGGVRAHPDADRREEVGADYVLGATVIELKLLDEEGFDKPERQAKLAALFRETQPNRPVVVLNEELLPPSEQRKYRNAVEQPIKGAIAKAKKQLVQTRGEKPETAGSVLWIFNNGYTALDHETLEALTTNRIRQDTSNIDGVIVSGCYYHSDGYDSVFLWPCSYLPIRVDHSFPEFELLQEQFQAFANRFMTELMRQTEPRGGKAEVKDLVFDVDGIRYVRPAPGMGSASEFYVGGRPRVKSAGSNSVPAVALIVPKPNRVDLEMIAGIVGAQSGPLSSWESWQRHLESARQAATPMKPLVPIAVESEAWLRWCLTEARTPSLDALNRFAHDLFGEKMLAILDAARERKQGMILPCTYVLVVTQEIGQDQANDVSDIAVVRERLTGDPIIHPIAENIRAFHEHAAILAAAYALSEGIDAVLWSKNRRHGWV
jgi:hypothetical protein